jgi:hypothetical protein
LKEKWSFGRLLELLNILKEYKDYQQSYKNIGNLSQEKTHDNYDPHVDLEINDYMVHQVVVDFG